MKNLNKELFQELIEKYGIETLEWQDNILKELKKKMLETALEWELWYELWYKKWERRKKKKEKIIEMAIQRRKCYHQMEK